MKKQLRSKETTDTGADMKVNEEQIHREMGQKFKCDYEEKMRREQEKKEEEERRKQEQEAKARREAGAAWL